MRGERGGTIIIRNHAHKGMVLHWPLTLCPMQILFGNGTQWSGGCQWCMVVVSWES